MPATEPRPLRLALCIGSLQEGGRERQVTHLAIGLRQRGHDVRVLVLRDEGPWRAALEQAGVPVDSVDLPPLRPVWHPRSWAGGLAARDRTVRWLRAHRPDVLHANLFEAEAWCAAAVAGWWRGPLVTIRVSMGNFKDAARWKQVVQDQVNRRTRCVIANTHAVARDARRRERHLPPIEIIPGGVDIAKFTRAHAVDWSRELENWSPGDPVVLVVANLFAYKGHFDLFEAWRAVQRAHPRARLVCVGRDAGIGGELRRRARELGIAASVTLLGPRQDVPELLAGADLLVHPSHEEGLPNAVLEAMAAGRAVVATAVGGTPDAVAHRETGYLVPPRDSARLGRAIIGLLSHPVRRARMGEAGRARVRERFSIEAMVDAHEALYRRLVQSR